MEKTERAEDAKRAVQPRRRNRVAVACSVCRRRKIKCDRSKPHCQVCVRYNVTHLCTYEELSTKRRPLSSPEKLKTLPPPTVSQHKPYPSVLCNKIHTILNPSEPPHISWAPYTYSGQSNEQSLASNPALCVSTKPKLASLKTPPAVESGSDASKTLQAELERIKQQLKHIEESINASPGAQNAFPGAQNAEADNRPGVKALYHTEKQLQPPQAAPYISPTETIDFYKGYVSVHMRHSRIFNHGPLNWLSVLKRDPFLKVLWAKVIEKRRKERLFPWNLLKRKRAEDDYKDDQDTGSLSGQAERVFMRKLMEQEGFVDIQPYQKNDVVKEVKRSFPIAGAVNKKSQEMSLIKKIEAFLPNKKVIWLAFDRYFKYIYLMCPILDEELLLEELSKLIGSKSYEDSPVNSLALEKRLDFATVGILLLVIRLGYLTTMTNSKSERPSCDCSYGDEIDFLLKNPVSPQAAVLLKKCLDQFNLLGKTTLSIFQLAVLTRQYNEYAPEEATNSDSLVFSGMLVQVGISLGLNRDPQDFGFSDKQMNLWRKLWGYLLISDMKQLNVFGSPQTIQPELYDTKRPVFEGYRYNNNLDISLEKFSVEYLNRRLDWSMKLSKIASLVRNLKNPPKLVEVLQKIESLEHDVKSDLKGLYWILTPNSFNHVENLAKVEKLIEYLEMVSTIHSCYYHIFLHLEEQKNTRAAFHYLKRMLALVVEFSAFFLRLLINLPQSVGIGFDVLLTPRLEMATRKTLQIQFSLVVRILHYKKTGLTSSEVLDVLDQIHALVLKNCDSYITGLVRLSDRYYYAWRMNKSQKVIFDLLKVDGAQFFEQTELGQLKNDLGFDLHQAAPSFNVLEHLSLDELEAIAKMVDSEEYLKHVGELECDPKSSLHNLAVVSNVEEDVYSPDFESIDKLWYDMMMNDNEGNLYNSVEESSMNNETLFMLDLGDNAFERLLELEDPTSWR